MFNNLIESNSHTREFKRRGRFVLFTMGAYALLFVGAGVASIYAYDAHLDDAASELIVTMLPPDNQPKVPQDTVRPVLHGSTKPTKDAAVSERTEAVASVNQATLQPPTISTAPNTVPPLPPGPWKLGDRNIDVGSPGPSGPVGVGPGSETGPTAIAITEAPAPQPVVQKPVPQIVHKSVINGEAIELPKPPYPQLAKVSHTQGTVNVQVLIDETGRVISAHAVLGSPLLTHAAEDAARRARFSATKIGDQPVKVSGVITYNFVLQ